MLFEFIDSASIMAVLAFHAFRSDPEVGGLDFHQGASTSVKK
jgi:hypothetical protein